MGELRAQLDRAGSLRFARKEMIWLAGNSFYGHQRMFAPDFLAWLANFRLPDHELRAVDGQFELRFPGPWTHTTMWEIPALSIVNELRSRAALKGRGRFELDILYARTNLTNDFRGCDPAGGDALAPISLVAKVTGVEGRPAVKLSDNPAKATGDHAEIARYRRIFDSPARMLIAVTV